MNLLVIIVTYNGMSWLPRSLESAFKQSVALDVFVVDNMSTDGTPEYIKSHFKNVLLIEAKKNLGFGAANNLGLEYARTANYDFVFLQNQDVYLGDNTIERLLEIHRLNPKFGVISPMQLNGNGTALDQNFKENFENLANCSPFESPGNPSKEDISIYKVRFVMAAMWLISRDCFIKVGNFDSIFFHYGEDNDYLNRVHFHGFDVGVVSNALGCHDRTYRMISDLKKLEIDFAGLLAILTDPNSTLIINYLKVFKRAFILLIESIKKKNRVVSKATIYNTYHLALNLKKIIRSRKRNARPFSN